MSAVENDGEEVPRVVASIYHPVMQIFEKLIRGGSFSQISTSWRVFPQYDQRTHRENDSLHIEASFSEFYEWISGASLPTLHPLAALPLFNDNTVALYADYKYLIDLFEGHISSGNDAEAHLTCEDGKLYLVYDSVKTLLVDWSALMPNVEASAAACWLGSRGAYTPLHYDSYGSNVVFQMVGLKRWRLWKPDTSAALLPPLRVPYEESSIYSTYDPLASSAIAPDFDVLLSPGDVLYVPKHWWHFVTTESDVAFSMNMWQSQESDTLDRATEAIARITLGSFTDTLHQLKIRPTSWLAPSEQGGSLDCEESDDSGGRVVDHFIHMEYLLSSLSACDSHASGEERRVNAERVMKAIVNTLLQPDVLDRCVQECVNSLKQER